MKILFQKLVWLVILLATNVGINQRFVQVVFQLHRILNIIMIQITNVLVSVHQTLTNLEITVLIVIQEQIVLHATKQQVIAHRA